MEFQIATTFKNKIAIIAKEMLKEKIKYKSLDGIHKGHAIAFKAYEDKDYIHIFSGEELGIPEVKEVYLILEY